MRHRPANIHCPQSCKDYRLANLYPARAVALGCLSVVMEARGLRNSIERREWATIITGRKVDAEDLEEVVEALKGTQTLHFSR